jgi:predicted lysophospholipase L1 biosynthesis ABC-type transport system permease subunit
VGRLLVIYRLGLRDLRHRPVQAILLLLALTAGTASLDALTNAAGVAAHSGPFPVTWTLLHTAQSAGSAEVEGRDTSSSSVDNPSLLQGGWVRPGGVVVEGGFASVLGVHVGDPLTHGGSVELGGSVENHATRR